VALLGDRERSLLLGIAVGAACVIFGRRLLTPVRRLARPTAKAALKSGLTAVERSREMVARLSEELEDLAAEVEAERVQAPNQRK
jgi:hypothetical protein